jgi:flagellar motor switch protein FliM
MSDVQVYDFRRTDRIARDQIRAINMLHESFARSISASLSAYLRAYVVVNLVSVEQISFTDFTNCLPSPTSLMTLGIKPYEGNAVLEINPSLVFPILEMLLGGAGKASGSMNREITEIEQTILDGLLRIILSDLRTAWGAVTSIDFGIDSHETKPELLQVMAPNEAVVVSSIEIRIGDMASGLINIAIPSILVKMLRQKFDQQWSVRRTEVTEEEQARVLRHVRNSNVQLEARLQGPTVAASTLLEIQEGDVLGFDFVVNRPLDLLVNGKLKYHGEMVEAGGKRALQIHELTEQ